ncbi:SURF1 family protein [Thalassotalea sp. M1531]|uniref:SURF1-like protein n=1 Tax=Thalassotalea algicola TaxID=2716224 RepID=A0A7Y0Q835_9GAMM|nr:SURF1 family protein [Thalassotalea algicola]NMP33033.1 SURF1 family protein [Thalassotalea algicola]
MGVNRLSSLFRAVNIIWLAITLLVFSGLIKLGLWQAERASEKEVRLSRIEQLLGLEHQPLENVLATIKEQEILNDQPVILNGQFDPEVLIVLDNQSSDGRLGYRVFQLFHHQEELPVLVNLGWVSGSRDRSVLPDIEIIKGTHQLKGNIRYIEPGIVLAEQAYSKNSIPLRVQQVEIEKLGRLFSKQLLPFAVYLDKNEVVGYKKHWQPVVMPPEKHRGYAFQWFSLAIAWLALMIWAAWKNNNKKAN